MQMLVLLRALLICHLYRVSSAACTPGYIGTNCTIQCHCLNVDKCIGDPSNDSLPICSDGRCNLGWTNPPNCKTECPEGTTFGENCSYYCHCLNNKCDRVSGLCDEGCHPDWTGASCQIRLPKLITAPHVTEKLCFWNSSQFTISWLQWSNESDIGDPPVGTYSLWYRDITKDEWTNTHTTVYVSNVTRYNHTILGLLQGLAYTFRVRANRVEFGKIVQGVDSPQSNWTTINCSLETSPPPESTTPIESTTSSTQTSTSANKLTTTEVGRSSSYVNSTYLTAEPMQLTTVIESPSSILSSRNYSNIVNFTIHAVSPQPLLNQPIIFKPRLNLTWATDSAVLTSFSLTYTKIKIGNCSNTSGITPVEREVKIDKSQTSYIVENLDWWSEYNLTIGIVNGSRVSQTAMTSGTLPPRVQNLQNITTSTTAQLEWDPVACKDFNGYFHRYIILYTVLPEEVRNTTSFTSRVTITHLKPYTQYVAMVQIVNHIGLSPYSEIIKFLTREDVPTAPDGFQVVNTTSQTVFVSWLSPNPSNGIIHLYSIKYSATLSWKISVEVLISAGTGNNFELTDLKPATTYYMMIKAKTSIGFGSYSDIINTTTQEDIPGAPDSITLLPRSDTSSCIGLKWTKPIARNGKLIGYKISVHVKVTYVTQVKIPSVTEVSPLLQSYNICNLSPSTQYQVSVFASTAQGYGKSKTADFWTNVKQPDPPPTPIFVNRTGNEITVQLNPVPTDQKATTFYQVTVGKYDLGIEISNKTVAWISSDRFPTIFVVGDNKTYSGYWNAELDFKSSYNIYLTAVNVLNGNTTIATSQALTVTNFPVTASSTVSTAKMSTSVIAHTTPVITVSKPLKNVQIKGKMSNSITVQWEMNLNYNGEEIVNFNVTYASSDGSIGYIVVSTQQGQVNIDQLKPFTKYHIQIFSVSATGTNRLVDSLFAATDETVPSNPVGLKMLFRNESCLLIGWSPPLEKNGIILGYNISHKVIQSKGISTVIEKGTSETTETQYSLCTLHSAVLYEISIKCKTIKGFGVASTGFYWTEQGQPDPPSKPIVNSNSLSTVTLTLQGASLKSGPLTEYLLYVKGSSEKQKRDASFSGYITAKLFHHNVGISTEFVVGDNKLYNSYRNTPLKSGTHYDIYFVVVSELDGIVKTAGVLVEATTVKEITTASAGTNDYVYIIIVSIICILLIITVAILIFIKIRRRRRDRRNKNDRNLWLTYYENNQDKFEETKTNVAEAESLYGKWNETFLLKEPRYVTLDYMQGSPENIHVTKFTKNPPISIEEEYNRLPQGKLFSSDVAEREENYFKHRSTRLFAYDHSRVVLNDGNDDDINYTDYINASYIPGYKKKRAYIACQSPFNDDTTIDFWRMVVLENVTQIVMVGNTLEDGILKCKEYWPKTGSLRFGNIVVRHKKTEVFANFTVRNIQISTDDGTVRNIRQYQYTSWPVHSVPNEPISFLEFHSKISTDDINMLDCPILVHCGTGVSKTSVFIVVDTLLHQALTEKQVNIWKCCKRARQHRANMVRTFKQYRFIYDVLYEVFVDPKLVLGVNLRKMYLSLQEKNQMTNKSYIREQFENLQYSCKTTKDENEYSIALSSLNMDKNRNHAIVPSNKQCYKLQAYGIPHYINAIFIDTYRQRDKLILTHTPMPKTVVDFFTLVFYCNVSTIVNLDDGNVLDETCVDYIPTLDRKSVKYSPFTVHLISESHSQHITIRHLEVCNSELPTPNCWRSVKQIQINNWPLQNKTPKSSASIVSLIDNIQLDGSNSSSTADDKILVHSLDGAGHSGLFCVLVNLCERVTVEGGVNLFQTVKQIKNNRCEIVQSMAQYKFCHVVLWNYINKEKKDREYSENSRNYNTELASCSYQ